MAVLAFGLVACTEGGEQEGLRTVSETVSGDWIRVYFTSPRYPDDDAYHHGGLDEELAAVIEQAETSVDLATYDLDLERVTSALIAAHRDGVRVRVVTESDNAHEDAITNLQQAGIPVVEDGHDWGLMHNKFAVIDGQWVWIGLWSLTENGTYCSRLMQKLGIRNLPDLVNLTGSLALVAIRVAEHGRGGQPPPNLSLEATAPIGAE
jgi:hypothetical protein